MKTSYEMVDLLFEFSKHELTASQLNDFLEDCTLILQWFAPKNKIAYSAETGVPKLKKQQQRLIEKIIQEKAASLIVAAADQKQLRPLAFLDQLTSYLEMIMTTCSPLSAGFEFASLCVDGVTFTYSDEDSLERHKDAVFETLKKNLADDEMMQFLTESDPQLFSDLQDLNSMTAFFKDLEDELDE